MNSHLCEFWDVIKFDLHEEVFNRFFKKFFILCMQVLHYYMGAFLKEAFGSGFTDSCEP